MILKLGIKHQGEELYTVYMGHYQKMEHSNPERQNEKKIIAHFFFFNGIVLLTGACVI